MTLADRYNKSGDARLYRNRISLLNGREVRQTEARTPTLLPKAQYTMPEAADYIVARLDRENLKLPLDQPRMLAERLAKGMMVFRSDLESVLNTMINKFPHFSIGYRGTTIEAEPANLVAPACDISYKDLNSLNPLEIWMRDIGRYRLLTAQEEVYYGMMKDSWKDRAEKRKELIEKTGMGDLTARQDVPYDPDQLKNPISLSCAMSSVSLPGSETHQNKAAKTRSGGHEQAIITHKSQKTAIDYLIRHNLRLVISPAVKVAQNSGMDVMALIAEGSMSLMKAAYNFDYKKGNKFSTYAMWWVKQALTRAAQDQKQTIRIPVHVSELRGKIKRHSLNHLKNTSQELTPVEIARQLKVPFESVENAMRSPGKTISLDQKIGEDATFENFQGSYEPKFYEIETDDTIEAVLDTLVDPAQNNPGVNKAIICLRFGLAYHLTELDIAGLIDKDELHQLYGIKIGGGRYGTYTGRTPSGLIITRNSDSPALTLEEIGSLIGRTRERVRQIESKALKRLRHPSRSKRLKDLYPSQSADRDRIKDHL